MSAQGFYSLPTWARTKLVESLLEKKKATDEAKELATQVDSGGAERASSFGKRKRPASFVESDLKRVEVEKGVMAAAPAVSASTSSLWQVRKSRSNLSLMSEGGAAAGWESSESLSAALERDHDAVVRRRRPRELKTVEGRKRPASKSIEEVLYPARYSQHSLAQSESAATGATATPVTPSKTEFNLLPSLAVRPYPKEFDGLGAFSVESVAAR